MSVVIFSVNGDESTSDVMDWIHHFGNDTIRINEINEEYFTLHLQNENNCVVLNDKVFSKKDIISTWLRKAGGAPRAVFSIIENKQLNYTVNAHIKKEFEETHYGFNSYFNDMKMLGPRLSGDINKLYALQVAARCRLDIPETIVTNTKKKMVDFFLEHDEIICKCISNGVFLGIDPFNWVMYTVKLTKDVIEKLPDKFFPCLVQEYIEKEYEIRTLYLDGNCYSMAIFSQADEQTATDFRKYNIEKPNRTVPYQLPKELEIKINEFMKAAELNTGSLDIIKSKDGRYIFLEVNVSGQFGMVSYPCNYFLEREIAKWLSN